MGRLRAALRVAQNHGCGPAFQRVLAVAFFEANGSLKPSHQGRRQKSNDLLDDEGFYMGVQRWLRTLEVGTVSASKIQKWARGLHLFNSGQSEIVAATHQ